MMDPPTFIKYDQDIQNISINVYSLDDRNGIWNKMYTLGPIIKKGDIKVYHKVLSTVVRLYLMNLELFPTTITKQIPSI